jgi:hypothetical protein
LVVSEAPTTTASASVDFAPGSTGVGCCLRISWKVIHAEMRRAWSVRALSPVDGLSTSGPVAAGALSCTIPHYFGLRSRLLVSGRRYLPRATHAGPGPVCRHLCRKDNAPGRLHLALTGGSPINGVIPAGCGPLRAKVKITHHDMAGWTPGSGCSRQARAM